MPTNETKTVYAFTDFRLIPSEKLLLKQDKKIQLRPKTFALLVSLVENAGNLCDKQSLLADIWDDANVEEGNLNRTVSELRKALGDSREEPTHIETIPRVGYRFIAEVSNGEKVVSAEADESKIESIESIPAENKKEKKNEPSAKPKWFSKFVYVAIAGVMILGFAYLIWKFVSPIKKVAKGDAGEIQLTRELIDENAAFWTTDGRIRFASQTKEKPWQRGSVNPDGSNPNLEEHLIFPDGKRMIIQEKAEKVSYISNLDGSDRRKLPIQLGNMDWSRVSNEIVAQYRPDLKVNNWELGILNLDTLEITNITNSPAFEADPSFSSDAQEIAFTSSRDGNAEIYIMNRDGTNVRRITNNPAWESYPTISPDGTQIIYNSDRFNEKNNAYIMNLDGSGKETPLPTGEFANYVGTGAWSPDGTKIAFSSDRNGNEDIFLIDAELTKPTLAVSDQSGNLLYPVISRTGDFMVYLRERNKDLFEIVRFDLSKKAEKKIFSVKNVTTLSISPDGKRILFQNKIDGNSEICMIDIDGSNLQNISNSPASDSNPVFSPDGSKIVFSSNRGGNTGMNYLYLMDTDGGNQRKIVSEEVEGTSLSPTWSKDGDRIFFINDKEDGRNGNFEIFQTKADGTGGFERVTNRPRAVDESPSVSPDGKKIVFQSMQKGNTEIFLIHTDGTGLLRLTRNLADDRQPTWSPDGSKIYFSSNRNGKFEIFEMSIN